MEPTWNETIANKIVAFYLDNLGQGENRPGSNLGKLPDRCYRCVHGQHSNPELDTTANREWCAECYCLACVTAGIANGPKTASTSHLYLWGQLNGKSVQVPRMGDAGLVLAPNSPTGFVHTVCVEHNFGDGMIHAVAGNEGNQVKRSLRPIETMRYMRPYG